MLTAVTGFASRCGIVLALMVIAGCGGEPTVPEEELRAWVDDVHAAVEAKDRGEIVDRISASYMDARGNGRDDIENMLRVLFLRQSGITVMPSIADIEVIGGTAAEMVVSVALAGTTGGIRGISADAYRFELQLEDDGDDWKLISARWGELGQQVR